MRNCTAANKLAASAGKVHGGLTVKCDTHKGLQFTLLVFIFLPIILKCKYKSLLLDRTGQKSHPEKWWSQFKEPMLREGAWRQTDDHPATRQVLSGTVTQLAIGYILISPIFFSGQTYSWDCATFMFLQLTSVQRRLRAVKSHLFAWAVLYLNIASCSEKWAVTYLESSILKLLTWKIYPAMHLELQVLPYIASGHFIANSATKWLFVE